MIVLSIYYIIDLSHFFLIPILLLVYIEISYLNFLNKYLIALSIFIYLFFSFFHLNIYNILLHNYYFSLFFILILLITLFSPSIFYKLFFFNLVLLFGLIFSSYLYIYNKDTFFIIIIIASINDISAYIFGNILKGPKIIKKISPNKTWTGTISSFIISFILLHFLNYNFYFIIIACSLFFLGDLYFSYFKRLLNIKDYGNLIKGHGGILDRIDSSLFPIVLFLLLFQV